MSVACLQKAECFNPKVSTVGSFSFFYGLYFLCAKKDFSEVTRAWFIVSAFVFRSITCFGVVLMKGVRKSQCCRPAGVPFSSIVCQENVLSPLNSLGTFVIMEYWLCRSASGLCIRYIHMIWCDLCMIWFLFVINIKRCILCLVFRLFTDDVSNSWYLCFSLPDVTWQTHIVVLLAFWEIPSDFPHTRSWSMGKVRIL